MPRRVQTSSLQVPEPRRRQPNTFDSAPSPCRAWNRWWPSGSPVTCFRSSASRAKLTRSQKTVLETGDVPPPALTSTLDDLAKIFREVELTTAVSGTNLTSHDRELVKIAKECTGAAAALKQELDKIPATPMSGKGRLFKSWWRSRPWLVRATGRRSWKSWSSWSKPIKRPLKHDC